MSGQIRMTPDTMRERAGEVRVQRQDFEGIITKMTNIINELQTEWEGNASQKFAEQFHALEPSFSSMKELLEDLSKQLDGTADAIEQLDNEIAGKFQI